MPKAADAVRQNDELGSAIGNNFRARKATTEQVGVAHVFALDARTVTDNRAVIPPQGLIAENVDSQTNLVPRDDNALHAVVVAATHGPNNNLGWSAQRARLTLRRQARSKVDVNRERTLGHLAYRGMALFYMHFDNGDGFQEDTEGGQFPDLAKARSSAISPGAEILAAEIKAGCLSVKPTLHIEDEDNEGVARSPCPPPLIDTIQRTAP